MPDATPRYDFPCIGEAEIVSKLLLPPAFGTPRVRGYCRVGV
jgi:hypothetical protein